MTQLNFRIDEEIKNNAESALKEMGLNMSTAITIFLTKVAREKRIPFEINADPFYSCENMRELKNRVTNIKSGKTKLKEHKLIEEND